MMMSDQGTRDPAMPWPQAIAELMKSVDADGINGNRQDGVPLAFSLAAEKIGHPLAFEPKGSPSDEALAWNVMGWGQYKFPSVPEVDRFKWLEARHMVNISDGAEASIPRQSPAQDPQVCHPHLQSLRRSEPGRRLYRVCAGPPRQWPRGSWKRGAR
jgi:hypothetical protein